MKVVDSLVRLAAFATLATLGVACDRGGDPKPGKPDAVYTVRGIVTQLPLAGKPTSEFRVKHEPIDSYANKDGKVVGMGTMDMPFAVADRSVLEGIQAGDIVEMQFEIWWTPQLKSNIRALKVLPAGTELHFGPAKVVDPE